MILTPLIDKTDRKKIGWDQPVIRIYPHNTGAIVLINKACVRKMHLAINHRLIFGYHENDIYIAKSKLDEWGFSLNLEKNGRYRFCINQHEYYLLLSFCKKAAGDRLVFNPIGPFEANPIELIHSAFRLELNNL